MTVTIEDPDGELQQVAYERVTVTLERISPPIEADDTGLHTGIPPTWRVCRKPASLYDQSCEVTGIGPYDKAT